MWRKLYAREGLAKPHLLILDLRDVAKAAVVADISAFEQHHTINVAGMS